MDNLILTLLGCCGFTLILKYGTILSDVRDFLTQYQFFKNLFVCSLCLGFWTGCIIGIFKPYNFILLGFASACCSWFADHLILLLKEKIWPT